MTICHGCGRALHEAHDPTREQTGSAFLPGPRSRQRKRLGTRMLCAGCARQHAEEDPMFRVIGLLALALFSWIFFKAFLG